MPLLSSYNGFLEIECVFSIDELCSKNASSTRLFGVDQATVPEKQFYSECNLLIKAMDLLSCLVLVTNFYTKQQFKTYKSLEAYNFVVSRFITSTQGCTVSGKDVVTGKVRHSQRMNDPLKTYDRTVKSVNCLSLIHISRQPTYDIVTSWKWQCLASGSRRICDGSPTYSNWHKMQNGIVTIFNHFISNVDWIVLLECQFSLTLILVKRYVREKKKLEKIRFWRKYWAWTMMQGQTNHGQYYTLFAELRLTNQGYFFRYHEFSQYDLNHWNTSREKIPCNTNYNWQHFPDLLQANTWQSIVYRDIYKEGLPEVLTKVRNSGWNWVVTSYIASVDLCRRRSHKIFSLPTMADNSQRACNGELASALMEYLGTHSWTK